MLSFFYISGNISLLCSVDEITCYLILISFCDSSFSSKQSTPKKVSFRKFIENGKAKTSVYLPFRKYIQNYKLKKKVTNYSPINSKREIISKIQASLPEEVSGNIYVLSC